MGQSIHPYCINTVLRWVESTQFRYVASTSFPRLQRLNFKFQQKCVRFQLNCEIIIELWSTPICFSDIFFVPDLLFVSSIFYLWFDFLFHYARTHKHQIFRLFVVATTTRARVYSALVPSLTPSTSSPSFLSPPPEYTTPPPLHRFCKRLCVVDPLP